MRRAARCRGKNWKPDELDALVIGEIKKLSFSREIIEKIITEKRGNHPVSNQADTISDRLEELEKQLNKIMDLYTLGNIPLESISQKADAITKEQKALQAELERLEPKKPTLSVDKAIEISGNAEAIFSSGSLEEKRLFVNSLIDRIVLLPSGDIEIYWKFT